MTESHIRNVIEAALLAAGKPLQAAEIVDLFAEAAERPTLAGVQAALSALAGEYSNRGIEVKETAAGFRIQVRADFSNEISRLWPERPAKYSRALLETLAIIAYRQPITRAEIEAVRGVAVNPNIVKTVIERNWVHVVGHRDVPGRPELLGTTRDFLDYFGLKRLDELPPLAELKSIGEIKVQFDLPDPGPLALTSDAAGAAAEPGAIAGDVTTAAASDTNADNVNVNAANGADIANSFDGANVDSAVALVNVENAGAGPAANAFEDDNAHFDSLVAVAEAEDADAGTAVNAVDGNNADSNSADVIVNLDAATAGVATTASGDADATSRVSPGTGENAAPERTHEGTAVNTSAGGASAQEASTEGAAGSPLASAEYASGDAPSFGDPTAEAPAAAQEPATSVGDSKKRSPSGGRGSGRKKKRGKSQTSDSALHEAEEFAASVDADLAAGDDDGSDEDELSAAGPDSSELVAGPRDIDQ